MLSGETKAIITKGRLITSPNNMLRAVTFLMFVISFFPKNCDINSPDPPKTPARNILNTKKNWFATPTDATETSPKLLIITVSITFTEDEIRF